MAQPTDDNNVPMENQITASISFTYNEDGYSDTGLLEINF